MKKVLIAISIGTVRCCYAAKEMLIFPVAILLTLLVSVTGCTRSLPDGGADTVFLNGKVYTQNRDNSREEAIAIDGKRISYVGDNQQASYSIL